MSFGFGPGRAVVAVGLALLLVGCTHSGRPASAPKPGLGSPPVPVTAGAGVSASAPPLTSSQAAALTTDLSQGTDDGLRAAVVTPAGQTLDPSAAAGLAALGPISFDVSTFQMLDATDATVTGQVAHPPTGTSTAWTFTLTYVGGAWKLLDMEPAA